MTSRAAGWSRLELAYAGSVLFLMTGAVVVLLAQGATEFDINAVERDSTGIRSVFLLAYVVMIALLLPRLRKFSLVVVSDPVFLLLLVVLMLSTFWSYDHVLTVQRATAAVLTCAFAFYLATSFPIPVVLQLVTFVLGCAMVLSLLAVLLMPAYGVSDLGWRGVFLFKNDLGTYACLTAFLAGVHAYRVDSLRARLLNAGLAALSALLVVGSQSKSALVTLVVGCLLLVLLPRAHRRVGWSGSIIAFGVAIVSGLYLAGARISSLFVLLGKDEDLTGRTPLWGHVWSSITNHMVVGYGFSGFWGGTDAPSAAIWSQVPWRPTHAHNAWLDLWLDLGLLGVALFAASLATTLFICLVLQREDPTPLSLIGIALIFFMAMNSLTGSIFLKTNVILTVLPLYVGVAVRLTSQTEPSTVSPVDACTKVPSHYPSPETAHDRRNEE